MLGAAVLLEARRTAEVVGAHARFRRLVVHHALAPRVFPPAVVCVLGIVCADVRPDVSDASCRNPETAVELVRRRIPLPCAAAFISVVVVRLAARVRLPLVGANGSGQVEFFVVRHGTRAAISVPARARELVAAFSV